MSRSHVPGHRASHVRLERGGKRISTLDLFDTAFVLLAGPSEQAWCAAAAEAAKVLQVPLQTFRWLMGM
ncbi:MAG: aromatic-ring hydroxylase C-terminal domain-containing protein [Dehalococcoidia bacterium]